MPMISRRMKPNTLHVACVAFSLLSANLLAQETAAQRHALATNQLKRLASDMTGRCLTQVRILDDWKNERSELRRQLLEMLGLDPMPPRTPLKAQITGR